MVPCLSVTATHGSHDRPRPSLQSPRVTASSEPSLFLLPLFIMFPFCCFIRTKLLFSPQDVNSELLPSSPQVVVYHFIIAFLWLLHTMHLHTTASSSRICLETSAWRWKEGKDYTRLSNNSKNYSFIGEILWETWESNHQDQGL